LQVLQSALDPLLEIVGYYVEHGRFAEVYRVIYRRECLYAYIWGIYFRRVFLQYLIRPIKSFGGPAVTQLDDMRRNRRIPYERIEQS
jgi:hypothetical protein